MLQRSRFVAAQGLIGASDLGVIAPVGVQAIIEGIDVSPSVNTGLAFAITLGSGGTRLYAGTLGATDPIETFSYRGSLPIYPGEDLWLAVSGGSVDVVIYGYYWPYPTPAYP